MSGAAERTGCVVLDAGNTKTRVAVWRDDPCGAQLWQGGEELGVLPTPTTTDPSPAAGVAALAAGTPTLPSVLVSVSPASGDTVTAARSSGRSARLVQSAQPTFL